MTYKGRSLGRFKTVSSTDLKMQSLRQGRQCGGPFLGDFFGELILLFTSSHRDNIKSCIAKSAVSAKVPGSENNK